MCRWITWGLLCQSGRGGIGHLAFLSTGRGLVLWLWKVCYDMTLSNYGKMYILAKHDTSFQRPQWPQNKMELKKRLPFWFSFLYYFSRSVVLDCAGTKLLSVPFWLKLLVPFERCDITITIFYTKIIKRFFFTLWNYNFLPLFTVAANRSYPA